MYNFVTTQRDGLCQKKEEIQVNLIINNYCKTSIKHLEFTSNINQQMHLYNFHLKHFKIHKTTPKCFDLF